MVVMISDDICILLRHYEMPNVHKNAFTTNKAAFFLVGRAAMYEQMYKCPKPSPLPPITTSAIDMRIYAETNE